ncbi:MAG: hypothetical protein Q9159_005512 [Coniocarpon cinnabarinum]
MAQIVTYDSTPPRHPTAHDEEYIGGRLEAVAIVFLVLTTGFTIARVVSSRIKNRPWGLEDTLSVPSYIFCLVTCILGLGAGIDLGSWSIIDCSMYHIASCLLLMKPLVQHIGGYFGHFRTFLEKHTMQSRDSVALAHLSASQAQSKGFATLPDLSLSEEGLVRDNFASKQMLEPATRDTAIGIRKDIWVTEANG